MHKDYRIFSHTADVGLIIYGRTLSKLFENAAYGMLTLLTDPSAFHAKRTINFKLSAPTLRLKRSVPWRRSAPEPESLLVDWLHEVLYYFMVKRIAFTKIQVKINKDGVLTAQGYGETIDLARHPVYREIKAVTRHGLKIRRSKNKWVTKIIFDI